MSVPSGPWYQKSKHNNLSFPEVKKLITMHHTLNIESVILIIFKFLNSWENRSFEWTDWSRIDTFLKEAHFQELFNRLSHAKPGGGGKYSNSTPPGGNGGGNSKSNSNIYGIPYFILDGE